jgi:hypothetical protein
MGTETGGIEIWSWRAQFKAAEKGVPDMPDG